MSRESTNKKSESNVTIITLSDDEDCDEVRIIEKENISTDLNNEVNIVLEKNRSFSVIKTVNTPPKNEPLNIVTALRSQLQDRRKSIFISFPITMITIDKNLNTIDDTHSDVSFGTASSSSSSSSSIKATVNFEKPVDTPTKVKSEFKEENITNTKPLEQHEKVKIEIKEEKIDCKKPLRTYEKVKSEIKKEKIDETFKSADNSEEKLLELVKKIKNDFNTNANKRKELDCDDKKDIVLLEIKPENVKMKQKSNNRFQSNRVVNPNYKKFKNDVKCEEKFNVKAEPSPIKKSNFDGPASSQSRSSKKRVNIMFTGVNHDEYEKSLCTIGGKIVSNPSLASILVTDQIRRKFKFTLAIARGIPIVSIQWVKRSIENKKFEDPFSYIIKDSNFEREYNFDLRESLMKARKKQIFDNYTFIITRNVIPKFSDLAELIEASGGAALINAPKIWKDHTFIVSCEKDLRTARQKKVNSPKMSIVPVVEASFITDSIWKQNINIKDNLLSY